jgi:hypothetical protein
MAKGLKVRSLVRDTEMRKGLKAKKVLAGVGLALGVMAAGTTSAGARPFETVVVSSATATTEDRSESTAIFALTASVDDPAIKGPGRVDPRCE